MAKHAGEVCWEDLGYRIQSRTSEAIVAHRIELIESPGHKVRVYARDGHFVDFNPSEYVWVEPPIRGVEEGAAPVPYYCPRCGETVSSNRWGDHRLYECASNRAGVSQQITRLLGTDDWAILHSGHQLVTAEDLDDMEGRAA